MEDRSLRFGMDPCAGQEGKFWQGTILECAERGLRFVVSADCDLAGDKGDGEFFCLSILTSDQYLERYALPAATGEIISSIVESAREVVPGFANVGDAALQDWLLSEGGADRWKNDLGSVHKTDLEYLSLLSKSLASLRAGLAGKTVSFLDVKVTAESDQLKKRVLAIRKKMKNALGAQVNSSRFDLYVLPDLPGRDEIGFVVPFRSLAIERRADVFASRSAIEGSTGFFPLATCRPMLVQALLQKLTLYFTRIGITDSFKGEQEAVVSLMLENVA